MIELDELPPHERAKILVDMLAAVFEQLAASSPSGPIGCLRAMWSLQQWARDAGCSESQLQQMWEDSMRTRLEILAAEKKGMS